MKTAWGDVTELTAHSHKHMCDMINACNQRLQKTEKSGERVFMTARSAKDLRPREYGIGLQTPRPMCLLVIFIFNGT